MTGAPRISKVPKKICIFRTTSLPVPPLHQPSSPRRAPPPEIRRKGSHGQKIISQHISTLAVQLRGNPNKNYLSQLWFQMARRREAHVEIPVHVRRNKATETRMVGAERSDRAIRRQRLHHPNLITKLEDRYIVQMANCIATLRTLAQELGTVICVSFYRSKLFATEKKFIKVSIPAIISDCTSQKSLAEEHLSSRSSLRVLLLTPTLRRLRLEWCRTRGNWTAEEWNQVVFSDESRFNLSSDDNHVRVWRPCGKRLNPAFALQRHTAPTTGVMV
ncbi:transposable element Tcb2 transposase [Trichonephila clavipes]|nr:transposable element Tcb2 transposase [Trichonephila clavipes]